VSSFVFFCVFVFFSFFFFFWPDNIHAHADCCSASGVLIYNMSRRVTCFSRAASSLYLNIFSFY